MPSTSKANGAICPSILKCLILFAFAIALTQLAHAQQFFGSIVGTVTDTSGAVVPGATETLINKATGEKRTATTNAAGEYTFVDLVPATYSVTIERANFKRQVRDSIIVDVNATVRVNAALQVGAVTETVEVNMARTVELQTDSGTVNNKVEAQQMDELPINGRNLMALVNITPGVIPSSPVEQGATMAQNQVNGVGTQTNPLSWGGGSSVYTINGGDNEEYLDGAPMNMLQGSNIGLMPTADSVQEFSIDTSANDSSEGRATGGEINQTAKSGTNSLHFAAYNYFRNADLNANAFINKHNGVGRPEYNQNLYGFNLGFPVKKDRIFFFGSYERDVVLTQAPTLTMEPSQPGTAATPGGNDIYDGVFNRPVVDPYSATDGCVITQNAVAGTWSMAQGVRGAGGCFDPGGLVFRSYWAAKPNITAVTNSAGVPIANYLVNMSAGDSAPEMNARMDFVVSPKQRIFAHTAWWAPLDKNLVLYPNANVPSALVGGKPWNLAMTVGGFNTNLYILGDTYTFSPKTVLDLRAEYLRFRYSMVPGTGTFDESQLGSNWATLNAYIPNGQRHLPSPNITTNNTGGNGSAENGLAPSGVPFGFSTGGQGQIWDNYGVNGTITHVFGKHSVRAGFEARLMDMEVLPNGYASGNPSFGVNYSCVLAANNNCTNNTGDEWADLLMGYFVGVSVNGSLNGTEFSWYQAYFAQDTFQATRKLTLNLGVRWELPGGLMEKKNSAFVFNPYIADPNTGAYGAEYLVASPEYPSRSIWPVKHGLFDPRLGFAYRVDDKTVVRGGYGISTQAVDQDGGGNGAAGNNLNSQTLSFTNPTGGGAKPTNFLGNPFFNTVTNTNLISATPSTSYVPGSIYVPRLGRTNPAFLQTFGQAQQATGGTSVNGFWAQEPLAYYQQYNFAVERQIRNSFKISASYVGSHAINLKAPNGAGIDQEAPSTYTVTGTGGSENGFAAVGPYIGTNLTSNIPAGLGGAGTVNGVAYTSGVFCTPGLTGTPAGYNGKGFCNNNIHVNRTLQPYPNYSNASIGNLAYANQHYNSLQTSTQWRIPGGGLIGSSFTWAKTIGNNVNVQDNYNRKADRAVGGNNGAPLRFVVNINYPLPIGQGKMFFNTSNPVINGIIGGWAINDISSFQHGGYLGITSNTKNQIQGAGTTRATYVPSAPGCNSNKLVGGSPVAKYNSGQWFNTACFAGVNQSLGGTIYMGNYDWGNEPANDPKLFAQGIDNQDISLAKTTKVAEKLSVVFRLETFNTFNRVQFSAPNTAAGNPAFGTVTSTANNPRWVQLSLRVTY